LEDLLAAHEKWLLDFNYQHHFAHEKREDGCHSPAAVLGWIRGMQPEPDLVYRVFSAICETRTLNKAGYAKFRNFLLCGEQGLAGNKTLVNIFQDTLTLEYGEHLLSRYSVEWQPDARHLLRVGNQPPPLRSPESSPEASLVGARRGGMVCDPTSTVGECLARVMPLSPCRRMLSVMSWDLLLARSANADRFAQAVDGRDCNLVP